MRFTTLLAVACIAAATSPPTPAEAQAQPQPVIEELRGSVGISVEAWVDVSEATARRCRVDGREAEQRAAFLLNQTRLTVTDIRAESLRRRPEVARLQAAAEAAENRRDTEAIRATRRAAEPYFFPLVMTISLLALDEGPARCVEMVRVEVDAIVGEADIRSSSARVANRPLKVFARGSLISGPLATISDQRARVVEGFVREFANAWAEANR